MWLCGIYDVQLQDRSLKFFCRECRKDSVQTCVLVLYAFDHEVLYGSDDKAVSLFEPRYE